MMKLKLTGSSDSHPGFSLTILPVVLLCVCGVAWGGEPESIPGIGPSESTLYCQQRVHDDYLNGTNDAIDQPSDIDPNEPIHPQGDAFHGLSLVTLPPGIVTPAWKCTQTNQCQDDAGDTPRGTALLWIPDGTSNKTPRILFIHGGSWYYGSPWTNGYPTFAAKLARRMGMPVLAIDYTLAPVGHFQKIIGQVGAAVNFLATHDPLDLRAGDFSNTNPPTHAPPLFILGDSSGGGTAVSALVAQASPRGLRGAQGAVLSGGVVFSPWINLVSNSPTYVSNLFAVQEQDHYLLGDIAFGMYDVESSLSADQKNAKDYLGRASLRNRIANPFFARDRWLAKLAPIAFHVGAPELLLSDSSILASRISRQGGSVEFHQYDGMWHDFPMYEDGCGSGETVVLARSAFSATRKFLYGIAKKKPILCGKTPCYYGHYEYPQGHDTARGLSSFSD
ncbi:alpha/beta hydrolase [Myxococcota bacterium]|nr:alpha/beta hydrolase [Myxococcota bacterium]